MSAKFQHNAPILWTIWQFLLLIFFSFFILVICNQIRSPAWVFAIRSLQMFPKAFCTLNSKTSYYVRFSRKKKGVEAPTNSVFDHFWKIVELNTDALEPSLLSEIDNWSLLLNWSLHGGFMSRVPIERNTILRTLKVN